VGKPDLATCAASFNNCRQADAGGSDWSPDAIQADYLGQSDQAWTLTEKFLKAGDWNSVKSEHQ